MSDELRDLFSPERLRRSWREESQREEQPEPELDRAEVEAMPPSARLASQLASSPDAQLCARLMQLAVEQASKPGGGLLVELVERLLVAVARHEAITRQRQETKGTIIPDEASTESLSEGAAAEADLLSEVSDPAALAERIGQLLDQIEDLSDAQRLGTRARR